MIFFSNLNESIRVIFIALCAIAFVGQLFFLCLCIGRKKNIILTVVTAVITVLSAFNVTRLAYGAPLFSQEIGFLNDDFSVIVAIAVNISLGTIAIIIALTEMSKVVLTGIRIPQYLDKYKDAVLFADSNGQILLDNYRMRELCKAMTKAELKDANAFCEFVFTAKSSHRFAVYNVDDKLIFRFPDGSAWEFARTAFEGGSYIVTATDATQTLDAAEKITENKRMLKDSENRLQWTLDNLDGLKAEADIAQQNEALRTQVRDYATALYQGILNDEEIESRQLGTQLIPAENQLPLIIRAFELIGVSVVVIGNMPADDERFTSLLELLFVTASSAVSFCRAERITMAIYEGGNRLAANITCDGT
ncbi:MAG: hypothetical protein IKY44_02290, partial [Clostridia bacterium]|nr:hypothetical protein [Clostridia bacterium]